MAEAFRAPCPVGGCPCDRSAAQFVCRSHWFALPRGLRTEINETWRSYQRNRRTDPQAAIDDLTRYRMARARALDLLTGEPEEHSHD